MKTGAEPNIVLFFDCPEEEMVNRVLNRNQVLMHYMIAESQLRWKLLFKGIIYFVVGTSR